MMGFDATYRTVATIVGRDRIAHEGQSVDALMVDIEWHHDQSDDIYPPGPDASGGRFWLVAEPPEGLPYVPQYQTDTYLVSTLIERCPE